MRFIAFGARNVYRNPARAVLAVLVLGLSVGLFVTMLRGSVTTAIEARNLKAEAGTRIEINEAGNTSGYAGTVTEQELPASIAAVSELPNVVKVERYVKRQFVDNRRTDAPTGVIIGVEPQATLRLQSMSGFVGTPKLLAGRDFTPDDAGQSVAIVGDVFARTRGVGIGDEFTLPGEEIQRGKWIYPHPIRDLRARVIGIFRVGVVYADNQIFVPLDVVQEIMGIGGDRVSEYIVTVDSAENVPQVAAALREALGPNADVISQDDTALQTARWLEAASVNSRVGAVVAAIAGALVILFTMVIVTRERTREIGVLKAIGASNPDITALFSSETATLAALAGGLGLLVHVLVGPILASVLVGPEVTGQASGGLGASDLASGLGLAVVFGLVGSLYAVWRAVRMRPSEAMRQR